MSELAYVVASGATAERLLTEIAGIAARAVPGADGAGLTMLQTGKPDSTVASAPFVREVAIIEYRAGEGPSISATATVKISTSGALGGDESWPVFGPRAAERDVHSALSLPMIVAGEVIGCLTIYAHAHDAFDALATRIAELFAHAAAAAVHNARVLDHAQQAAARMEAALTTRSTIDRAVGIIMSRAGVDADEAFVRLRVMSQQQHLKLNVVAGELVETAMRRALARTSRPVPTNDLPAVAGHSGPPVNAHD